MERGACGRPPGDDQIDGVVGEQAPDALPVADLEEHVGVGVAAMKAGQRGRYQPLPHRRHRSQADLALFGFGVAGHTGDGLIEQAEHPGAVPSEGGPGGGQAQAPALPGKQRHTDLALESRQRRRHRWLGDDELLGGRPDRSRLRDREEGPQLAERHSPKYISHVYRSAVDH
jgi:hypothetical protein